VVNVDPDGIRIFAQRMAAQYPVVADLGGRREHHRIIFAEMIVRAPLGRGSLIAECPRSKRIEKHSDTAVHYLLRYI
jgi:hypothetical protein